MWRRVARRGGAMPATEGDAAHVADTEQRHHATPPSRFPTRPRAAPHSSRPPAAPAGRPAPVPASACSASAAVCAAHTCAGSAARSSHAQPSVHSRRCRHGHGRCWKNPTPTPTCVRGRAPRTAAFGAWQAAHPAPDREGGRRYGCDEGECRRAQRGAPHKWAWAWRSCGHPWPAPGPPCAGTQKATITQPPTPKPPKHPKSNPSTHVLLEAADHELGPQAGVQLPQVAGAPAVGQRASKQACVEGGRLGSR